MEYLKPSSNTSTCPWKGLCNYYDVVVNGIPVHGTNVGKINANNLKSINCFNSLQVRLILHQHGENINSFILYKITFSFCVFGNLEYSRYYANPKPEAAKIKGHIAFYKGVQVA
jgi:uncharacterized protein (DUF427 family)